MDYKSVARWGSLGLVLAAGQYSIGTIGIFDGLLVLWLAAANVRYSKTGMFAGAVIGMSAIWGNDPVEAIVVGVRVWVLWSIVADVVPNKRILGSAYAAGVIPLMVSLYLEVGELRPAGLAQNAVSGAYAFTPLLLVPGAHLLAAYGVGLTLTRSAAVAIFTIGALMTTKRRLAVSMAVLALTWIFVSTHAGAGRIGVQDTDSERVDLIVGRGEGQRLEWPLGWGYGGQESGQGPHNALIAPVYDLGILAPLVLAPVLLVGWRYRRLSVGLLPIVLLSSDFWAETWGMYLLVTFALLAKRSPEDMNRERQDVDHGASGEHCEPGRPTHEIDRDCQEKHLEAA